MVKKNSKPAPLTVDFGKECKIKGLYLLPIF
jgi:hypothetical protein